MTIRSRVYKVLGEWAEVALKVVPPDTKKIVAIWRQNWANPELDERILSDLINRLHEEFPQAEIGLAPNDFTSENRADTVRKLVRYIENRMLGI